MAKIVLGKRPQAFKRVISFMLPGEKEAGTIEVAFKYRTRSEFAAFVDEMQASAKADAEKEVDRLRDAASTGSTVEDISQATFTARQNEYNARYVTGAVESWNLDVPFDAESVAQLVDELPSAVIAIISDYRAAIVDGRLGN